MQARIGAKEGKNRRKGRQADEQRQATKGAKAGNKRSKDKQEL
jgi:hypothetical protein